MTSPDITGSPDFGNLTQNKNTAQPPGDSAAFLAKPRESLIAVQGEWDSSVGLITKSHTDSNPPMAPNAKEERDLLPLKPICAVTIGVERGGDDGLGYCPGHYPQQHWSSNCVREAAKQGTDRKMARQEITPSSQKC